MWLICFCSALAVVGCFFSERQCRGPSRRRLPEPSGPPGLVSGAALRSETGRGQARRGEAGGGSLSGAVANSRLPGENSLLLISFFSWLLLKQMWDFPRKEVVEEERVISGQ